ncbi:hypothetical protein I4U23_002906 [Adineta vaga]|nr:hypothetical protein I4U23_002906 [Adineta vaga]
MERPRLTLGSPWPTMPYRFPTRPQTQLRPAYPITHTIAPFVLPQSKKPNVSPSPYTNTRYQHLKKSTHHSNRRALQRSYEIPTRSHYHNEPVYLGLIVPHSWHAMMNHRRANLSVAYANELHISPKRRRKQPSKKQRRPPPPPRPLSSLSSASFKRNPSLNSRRKRPREIPERGPVRISTLDEIPINNAQIQKQIRSISHERLSTKGSISTSSAHRMKKKGTSSIKNQKTKTKNNNNNNNSNDDDDEEGTNTDTTHTSISIRSRSSIQQRLNGSLLNDPLISAAIDDFRQYRRSSSQNLSTISSTRDRRRNRLHSISTLSSTSISRSHSQSSFTSFERSEIRHLMQTMKTEDNKKLPGTSLQSSTSEQSILFSSPSSTSMTKPQKSCITEELDREFNKLRALDPNREISYVIPSKICKRKKTLEKPASNLPPSPTFDQLLRQVQLRPVDRSTRSVSPVIKEQKQPEEEEEEEECVYENPFSPIPVPCCSPIPSIEISLEEIKHEYAFPIKKTEERSLPQISHFQPVRNYTFSNQTEADIPEKRLSRPLSMFNWFHNTPPTNPVLATFQPNRILQNQNEYTPTNVKENIYTSDIDVYVPISTIERNDNPSLQIHLDNQTILTDDFYTDYETKLPTHSSSILNDFSHLFARKHKHQHGISKKNQRCSIM